MRLVSVALAVVVVAAVALVAAPPAAGAEPPRTMRAEARVHYERGLRLYERRQYDDAIVELRAGLAVDPQPEILYALGQAERRRGHCDRAIEYYQSCLALVKDPVAAAAVKVQIERCNVEQGDEGPLQLPAQAAPPTPTPPTPTPPTPAAPPAAEPAPTLQAPAPVPAPSMPTIVAPPPPRARWRHDALGLSLIGVGVAAAATGAALFGVAETRLDDAADGYQQYADARGAPTLRAVGIGGLALGGVLVVAGVVRLAVVGARH